jgi:transcriptional regulator with XRE-family HTH domain/energy-coupling factor transporter ATP-binding protein EcfA2
MVILEKFVPNEDLRRARHLKGWTQTELAEQVGTSFEMVSRWERGVTIPSAYFRKRLCSVLDKTAEELSLVRFDTEAFTLPPSPFVLFVSAFADTEKAIVTSLKAALHERGIMVWSLRQFSRRGDELPQRARCEVVRAAQAILMIVSPEARTSRHIREAIALASMYKRPMYGIWTEGEDWLTCLPRGSSELSALIDIRGKDSSTTFEEVITLLDQFRLAARSSVASTPGMREEQSSTSQPRNPYKGLQAFGGEDRQDFFGRQVMIDELSLALQANLCIEKTSPQSAHLLAVIGPSGSGKSSLVLAGLLPQLRAGSLPDSQSWVYLDPFVPGKHPLESLALTIAAHLPDRTLQTLREDLESDSARGLHLLASLLTEQREVKVVLFVDQFEEVFNSSTSEEERQQFIDLLVTAVTELYSPVIVILSLRADFLDRAMHYPELYRLLEAHQRVVLPLDVGELRAVIEQPAALPDVQLTFEGNLVGDLLFEAYGQPGALPLLEFTLTQLCERRYGRTLTLQAYQEMGGMRGALARYAEEKYTSLPSAEHHRLARVLFLRLIEPGVTEQETTRRRALLSELLLPDSREMTILQEVIQTFTAARLLTTSMRHGVATVEVSHEALIREWARLTNWLHEAREDVYFQLTICKDATEWERHGKPGDRLYRGSQLKAAQSWVRSAKASSSELAFIKASARGRMRFLVSVLTVCLLLLSLATVAVRFALNQPSDPTHVTNLQDNGPGSLRWAVDNAPPDSTITFDERLRGKTITLTSGDLQITRNLRLSGPSAEDLTISSDQNNESIMVYHGTVVTISNVVFKGTIGEGKKSGITNSGTLTLINSTVSDYQVWSGIDNLQAGGITNSGTLSLINSIVADNNNDGDSGGSGIINSEWGMLTLVDSTVAGNSSSNGDGGAILNGGTLALINSTVAGNSSRAGNGGGIFNLGTLTLTNSTIWDNSSLVNGGGIFSEGPAAQTTITFCTIYDNRADNLGGGIWNGAGNEQLVMGNSIIAGNTAFARPDMAGRLTSKGYNLLQDTTGAIFTANSQHTTDLVVAPHTSLHIDSRISGRSPQTLALLPGSPAIDAIPLDACSIKAISTDQRGVKRPDGHEYMCDIGAYEYTD